MLIVVVRTKKVGWAGKKLLGGGLFCWAVRVLLTYSAEILLLQSAAYNLRIYVITKIIHIVMYIATTVHYGTPDNHPA